MQNIEDQINTIERALGERMVNHALIIVRSWLVELGEDNPYEHAFTDIQQRYNDLFSDWLSADDPEREDTLDRLTGDTYRLVDAVYASIRVKRGLSPEMHGFNGDNPQSIMHYFSSCVSFRESDFEWLRTAADDSSRSSLALIAVAAIAKNLRECFSEQAFYALIDCSCASSQVVAQQCLANVMLLLAHYDVRIDFFPDLQNAFMEAVGDGESAFETLVALVRSTKVSLRDLIARQEITQDDMPEELRNLLGMTGEETDISSIASWVPASETEYMSGIVQILPDTWVYTALIGDNTERRAVIAMTYLSIGKMDLVWDHIDRASAYLVQKLRKGKGEAIDYINYGHCLMLQGDRMMAFENYRQARMMCKGAKEFYALFRPDRRQLVDRGVPLEQVYLIEDQLFSGN
ncbi:MAG: hypothetical protein IJ204_08790 [Paludibacteraceae bacterium]|nr:hypothetical protein [Paludibacteraceae bacterium]